MASARASGSTNQYGIDFFTSFSRRMSITNSGTVGINTTNTQGYQFAVNGSAIFTSARVKAYGYWPDFVFGKDYRLPALDSVDQYIQTNHRLPDFPSADSIQRAGIDLGGTDAALLKKIEELTLYAIEQKKQMEEQKKQLAAQQAAMARLEMLVQTKIKH